MFLTIKRFLKSQYAERLSESDKENLYYLAKVFPFKVSRYVLENLINWDKYDEDPVYRLVFPRKSMLTEVHLEGLKKVDSLENERKLISKIRRELNPHPDGQKSNIPKIGGRSFGGIQHKYKETVLFFPAQGQTCHAYCTYCFRWAQFVNIDEHKFRSKDHRDLFDYLAAHKEVTDVLFTGGDPLFMDNDTLLGYIDIILRPELNHIKTIRLGSKALAYYPYRFLGEEGDILLNKFENIISGGKHIAFQAHFSHPNELKTKEVEQAIQKLRNAGVEIRTQAPLIKGINDQAETWRQMWQHQVELGLIPYYMFLERDTGAHNYFSVPLYKAYAIFTNAYSRISGLAKTVRGPIMSADPGKILIDGIIELAGEKHFILKYIQARNYKQINKPFLAKYSEQATWYNNLETVGDNFLNKPVNCKFYKTPERNISLKN